MARTLNSDEAVHRNRNDPSTSRPGYRPFTGHLRGRPAGTLNQVRHPDLRLFQMRSDLTGRTATRIAVDDEECKAEAVERGLPAPAADFTLGMFRAARDGEFAATDPALERLLARPAISARASIEEIVAAQRWDRRSEVLVDPVPVPVEYEQHLGRSVESSHGVGDHGGEGRSVARLDDVAAVVEQ